MKQGHIWIVEFLKRKKNPIHHTGMIFLHVFLQCYTFCQRRTLHIFSTVRLSKLIYEKKRLLDVKVDLVIDFYIKFY